MTGSVERGRCGGFLTALLLILGLALMAMIGDNCRFPLAFSPAEAGVLGGGLATRVNIVFGAPAGNGKMTAIPLSSGWP